MNIIWLLVGVLAGFLLAFYACRTERAEQRMEIDRLEKENAALQEELDVVERQNERIKEVTGIIRTSINCDERTAKEG